MPGTYAGASGGGVISATEWTWIDAANPSTVETNSVAMQMKSTSDGVYEDTSAGQIAIVNFGKQISLSGSEKIALLLGTPIASHPTATANLSGTVSSASATTLVLQAKIIPITASFSTAALTWNNVITAPTLTYGSALLNNVQIARGSFSSSLNDKPTAFTVNHSAANNEAISFLFSTGTAFYGLQIEICTITIVATGLSLSSVSCNFQTGTFGSVFKHPLLIKPLS